MNRVRLTKNFSLDEFTQSDVAKRHGIDLVVAPNSNEHQNLKRLCQTILQPLRTLLKKPVLILSGYRNNALNTLIQGAPNSQHLFGCAADIRVPGMSSYELAVFIRDTFGGYDQLINEFDGWVHVSVPLLPDSEPREQELTTLRSQDKATMFHANYYRGIHRGEALRKGIAS